MSAPCVGCLRRRVCVRCRTDPSQSPAYLACRPIRCWHEVHDPGGQFLLAGAHTPHLGNVTPLRPIDRDVIGARTSPVWRDRAVHSQLSQFTLHPSIHPGAREGVN